MIKFQDEFQVLLDGFKEAIKDEPSTEKVKPTLEKLKEGAKLSATLTLAQKDAILARCDNYLAGTYKIAPALS